MQHGDTSRKLNQRYRRICESHEPRGGFVGGQFDNMVLQITHKKLHAVPCRRAYRPPCRVTFLVLHEPGNEVRPKPPPPLRSLPEPNTNDSLSRHDPFEPPPRELLFSPLTQAIPLAAGCSYPFCATSCVSQRTSGESSVRWYKSGTRMLYGGGEWGSEASERTRLRPSTEGDPLDHAWPAARHLEGGPRRRGRPWDYALGRRHWDQA